MKPIIILSLALLAVSAAAQDAPRRLTIMQCYEQAREHYPLTKRYGLIAQTESYNVANAGKGLLPQLTLNARATYQSDITKLPLDADRLSAIIPGFSIPTVSKDQYQMTAELSQVLWDGGNVRWARALSHAQAEIERRQLDADLYMLNERVNQVYFGCLLQDELLLQNALLQKELRLNIERVQAMINNGLANDHDRERLEVELLNAAQRETGLEAARQAYLAVLRALTGLPEGEELSLTVPALPGLSSPAKISRPELAVLDARDNMAETQRRQTGAGVMPRIGLFLQGGYGRPGLNMLEDSFEPFYVAGVRLSWSLGNFYTLKNDRRRIDASRHMVDVQRETFLFLTSLQVIGQNADIDKIHKLLLSDGEIVRLRESIRKAAEAKLAGGVISVSDLVSEINAEDMARQALATHRIQLLAAVYDLLYTTNE
ncbi:MAG: TolC family protein [Tannerellaceae bacterium]|jgi:outer membrane protein TolC|nr:TolC family protein [Tannerellaceae bacterium]